MTKIINLAQALKIKNRLAGEIARKREVFRRENCRRSDNPSKIDATQVLKELNELTARIIKIKTQIAKANVGIYETLANLEEAKGRITFFNSLATREGEEVVPLGRDNMTTMQWKSTINLSDRDKAIEDLQRQADSFQDAIDTFNATNTIIADL